MTPAAILSILVKTQGVSTAARDLKSVDSAGRKASKSFSMVGTAAKASAAFLGAAGFAKALGAVNSEYREAQKTGAQTNAVLKSTGDAAKVTQKHVENLANAISRKVGIDDEEIQASENMLLTFTKVRNETGKGNKIFDQATRVVTDMSVALGQSGKNSAIQLGKALNDPIKGVTALRRVGVTFDEQQQHQITTLTKHGDILKAQKIILAELTTEFGGSAAAQATAGDKMRVALGNLAEAAGTVLVPAIDKVTRMITPFIQGLADGTGAGGRFRKAVVNAFNAAQSVISSVVGTVRKYLSDHRADLESAAHAARNVGTAIRWGFETIALPIIKRVLPVIVAIVKGAFTVIGGAIKILTGLLTGDFRRAWEGVKDIFRGALKTLAAIVKGAGGLLKDAAFGLGKAIAHGVIDGLGQLGHLIFQKFKEAAGFVKDKIGGLFSGIGKIVGIGSGDGIGKGLAGGVLPSGGAFGGSLMGAQSALRPFAAIGSRFGLSVSSGRRPGAITTSGNVSYHSSGEAIDMAGTPAGMMATFRYLKGHYGGRLAELIYGPGRVGVKDGRPYNFGGALNAQHMDHVHVAFDTGRPGVGDGIGRRNMLGMMGDGLGKFTATSYGPPWGGIQGTGVTATGVNLKGGPHRYGVAVDPSVIPLGSKLKISPNPFGYSGAFTAFDTGGAIKGNRIDFYDWRGRAAQNGWGRRTVSIRTVGNAVRKAGKPKSGRVTAGGGVHQPTANAPTEAIQNFLRGARPLKGGGPNKGYTADQRPPTADAGDTADTGPSTQDLIDATNALKQAVKDVQKSIDDQTAFAKGVQATSNFQLTKSLADLVSGRIVGYGVAGRSFTPGTGVEVAY